MKNKRKLITLILTFILLIISTCVFSGCSKKEKLYLFNYGDYISPKVYKMFEEEYGVDVVYDEYSTPEEMYAKFTSGTVKYDLICTSDYMIEKLIKEDLLLELNYEQIPNIKNISEVQMEASKAFDPDNKYSIPHFWGTLGILYNTKTVDEDAVKSWDIIFDGSHSNSLIMPNSERDAFFVALTQLGYDTNTKNEKELKEAKELLIKQKKDVQAYLMDEAARMKVESENADLAVVYNGEAYLAFENNKDLAFTVPNEGTCMWIDSFVIPKNVEHKDSAEKFLNFLCREDVAKINFEYIYYSTPNQAVIDNLDKEVLLEEAIFPSKEVQVSGRIFKYLGKDMEELYAKLWKEIKSYQ